MEDFITTGRKEIIKGHTVLLYRQGKKVGYEVTINNKKYGNHFTVDELSENDLKEHFAVLLVNAEKTIDSL